jgi:hypothetical protein
MFVCQVLALIAELEARLDFDEDLPEMDAHRLQGQVCVGVCVRMCVRVCMCMCVCTFVCA